LFDLEAYRGTYEGAGIFHEALPRNLLPITK